MNAPAPSAGHDAILTDLADSLAACRAAELKGETDALIQACKWMMKQVPRAMKLIEDQQQEIERKDEALRKIARMSIHSEAEQQKQGIFWDWRDEANKALSPLQP